MVATWLFFNCNSNCMAECHSVDSDVLADGEDRKVILNLVDYCSINPTCFNVSRSQEMRYRSF